VTSADRTRLLEQRDHLLRSLDDLDAELEAGDIDRDDYAQLRDDYVARAADVTRALEGSSALVTTRPVPEVSLWRRIGWLGLIAGVALLGAWAMIEYSGARGSGDTASGEIRQSSATLLAEAAAAFGEGDPERSIELYGEVLEIQPSNVEALTYRGWVRYQTGDADGSVADFDEAVALDPDYADVRVFRTVAALDRGEFAAAAAELDAFDANDPAPIARQLVDQNQLRERVAAGVLLDALDATDGTLDLAASGIAVERALLAGETFVRLGQPADALLVFDAVLRVDPENAAALAWRGWTLALTAEAGAEELFVDAERWLDEAVAADPAYPDARVFRAFLLRRLGRVEDAAVELEAFDRLDVQPADMLALIEEFDLRSVVG
jgi:tetratricopeptide (TPR) repeat protein